MLLPLRCAGKSFDPNEKAQLQTVTGYGNYGFCVRKPANQEDTKGYGYINGDTINAYMDARGSVL